MHIYTDKRTGIKYISYTDPSGKRVRRSLGTKNKGVATLKAAVTIGSTNPDAGQLPNCPFSELVQRYQSEILSLRAPGTRNRFMSAYHRLEQFGLPRLISDVTPSFLLRFQLFLKERNTSGKGGGINRNVRAIRTLMHQAETWGLIAPQKWETVKRLREPKGRVEFHTPQEIREILSVCNTPEWQLVVLLGARAGLRRGEIAALKWADVDFANNQLYIAPNKTEKHRYVPISDDLAHALKSVPKVPKSPYVVHIGEDSNRSSSYYITAAYAKKTRNLPFRCFLHKLRHTFASHLVQQGVDLYRVSKLLGHSSITMTEIYAHLAPADLVAAVKKLPKI